MSTRTLLILALGGLLASAAHALPSAKTLAQFDLGFAKCEARFPHMKGHTDEAYLALWKIKADDRQRAALAKQRKSAKYREEREKARKAMAPDGPQAEDKIRNQCEATWSEALRNKPSAPTK